MQARVPGVQSYLYVVGTILFTVYGQLVLKWQVGKLGELPTSAAGHVHVLGRLLVNPWVASSITAAVLAFLCWAYALSRFELTYAYPFMSTTFALVLLLGVPLLGETLSPYRVIGVLLIVAGVALSSRS